MIDISRSPAFAAFRRELMETRPEALAVRIYGPGWRSSLRQSEYGWRTVRLPKALQLKPIFAELLVGLIVSDGRAETTRSAGWLASGDRGRWYPVDLRDVAGALHEALEPLLAEATSTSEAATRRRIDDEAERNRVRRTADLRRALIDALAAYLAADGTRNIGNLLGCLRCDDRFRLTDEAVERIVRDYVAAVLGRLDLGPGAHVQTAELLDAFARVGCPLPETVLIPALPAVFGPRRVNQGYRYFEIREGLAEGSESRLLLDEE